MSNFHSHELDACCVSIRPAQDGCCNLSPQLFRQSGFVESERLGFVLGEINNTFMSEVAHEKALDSIAVGVAYDLLDNVPFVCAIMGGSKPSCYMAVVLGPGLTESEIPQRQKIASANASAMQADVGTRTIIH